MITHATYKPKVEVRIVCCECGCGETYTGVFVDGEQYPEATVDVGFGILLSWNNTNVPYKTAWWKWINDHDAGKPEEDGDRSHQRRRTR